MKKLTALFIILVTAPVFAAKINANTPIKWNMNVVNEALKRVKLSSFHVGGSAWFEEPRSLEDIALKCFAGQAEDYHGCDGQVYDGNQMPSLQECYERCKNLVDQLINVNNEIAGTAEFAGNTHSKSTCTSNNKTLWLDSEGVCIPKNSCMFNQYEHYCIQEDLDWFDYYKSPKGHLTSADVVNIYVREKLGLNCQVIEQEVYKEYGYTLIPCKGADNRILRFADSSYSATGNITGLLCLVVSGKGANVSVEGTICEDYSQEDCEQIKNFVGDRIRVEYKSYVHRSTGKTFYYCEIGG